MAIAYGRIYVPTAHDIYCFEPVPADYKNEPQAAPAQPAGPLSALAKPFGGKPGEAAAGEKPKSGADWPMYGGSAARCGLDVKVALPIKEAWKFQTGGKVKSSPVIAGGTVYTGSDSGELLALELHPVAARANRGGSHRPTCVRQLCLSPPFLLVVKAENLLDGPVEDFGYLPGQPEARVVLALLHEKYGLTGDVD